jgi:hypothetical protein
VNVVREGREAEKEPHSQGRVPFLLLFFLLEREK